MVIGKAREKITVKGSKTKPNAAVAAIRKMAGEAKTGRTNGM